MILDDVDRESTREVVAPVAGDVAGGAHAEYLMDAEANTVLLTAAVETVGDISQTQWLTVEIYNPLGVLVATSLSTPGRTLVRANRVFINPGTLII